MRWQRRRRVSRAQISALKITVAAASRTRGLARPVVALNALEAMQGILEPLQGILEALQVVQVVPGVQQVVLEAWVAWVA